MNPNALLGYDRELYDLAQQIPGFAGLYIDEARVPHVQLLDVAQRGAADQAVASLMAAHRIAMGASPVYEHANHGMVDLLTWRVAARGLMKDAGVVGVGLDVEHNVVAVGVIDAASQARTRDAGLDLGIPSEALQVSVTGPAVLAAKTTDHVRPTTGGLKFAFTTRESGDPGDITAYCSIGINVARNGVAGLLTASHCSRHFAQMNGTTLWQPSIVVFPSNQIATEAYDPTAMAPFSIPACSTGYPCRYSDAMWASARAGVTAEHNIAITTVTGIGSGSHGDSVISYRDTTIAFGAAVAGQFLYKTGFRTGTTYGKVVIPCGDYNVFYDEYPAGQTVTLLCQGILLAGAQAGDSGSPIFFEAPNNDATVYGIMWGLSCLAGNTPCSCLYFSNISNVQSEIPGLSL